MEKFSRRDFLKVGAAGLVITGTGGVTLWAAADNAIKRADAVDLLIYPPAPDPPTKSPISNGYTLYCPSYDMDLDREYGALIRKETVNNVTTETPVLWGEYFEPFDGSSIDQTGFSSGTYWIARAIIGGIVYDSGPAVENLKVSESIPRFQKEPCPFRVFRDEPPKPYVKVDRNTGNIEVRADKWTPKQPDPNSGRRGGTLVGGRLIRLDIDPGTGSLRRMKKGPPKQPSNKKVYEEFGLGSDSTDTNFSGKTYDDQVSKTQAYAFYTEALLDYGADLTGPMAKFRYRAIMSKPRTVYIPGTVDLPYPPHNGD
jgi:hypothetical protein